MRLIRCDATPKFFRASDAGVARALGLNDVFEPPRGAEPEAAYGDLIVTCDDLRGKAQVAYIRVRRARFIALGSDGKRIACVDS